MPYHDHSKRRKWNDHPQDHRGCARGAARVSRQTAAADFDRPGVEGSAAMAAAAGAAAIVAAPTAEGGPSSAADDAPRSARRRRHRHDEGGGIDAAGRSALRPTTTRRGRRGQGSGLGWRLVLALVLLLAVPALIARAQQEDGDVDVSISSDGAVDGGKAWAPRADGAEDVSGNKTTALSHKPVPPETDPEYLAKAQALREQEGREPVVVLNGLGGAGLKFRLRGAQPTHPYCRTWYARWHTAWILPRMIFPPITRCLLDFITPVFDAATKTFHNKKGVEVEVKGFGQIVSLENLGPSLVPIRNFDYIRGFVKFMMTELGYIPGIDLFAAPYDWRYSPDVLKAQGYFTQLKALIESAYASSGNRRVHLLGHSLGGVVSLAFLNDMDLAWKRKHIKSYIPVGAPFGGVLMNLLGSVSGYNLGIPLNPADIRDFEALCPTGPWLFPRPCLWGPDEVLVQTPSRNYTAYEYETLLQDLGLHDAVEVYRQVFPGYLATLVPPEVDVHLVNGVEQPTVAGMVYNQSFSGNKANVPCPPEEFIYGPGDGTVPERSLLRALYEWGPQAGPAAGWRLTHHTFTGVDHMDSMNYRPFFRILTDILGDAVEHTPPPPEVAAAVKAPDWGWVMRKRFEAWDPVDEALTMAEKAWDGQ